MDLKDLRNTIVTQIRKSVAKNTKKERIKREIKQREVEKTAKKEQKRFLHDQRLLSVHLEVSKQIATFINEDPEFSHLRDKLVDIITDDPRYYKTFDGKNVHFFVSTTKDPYRINFMTSWMDYPIKLFSIYNNSGKRTLVMDWYGGHRGNINLPSRPDQAAKKIIKFLMTV